MELHERVRYLRKEVLNITQPEFAEELGTNRDTISNIEQGRLKRPEQKEPLLKLMCEKYGINESWLLSGAGEMRRAVDRDEEITAFMGKIAKSGDEDFRRRLVSVLCRLDVAEWELLEKMALKLAAEHGKENE